MPPFEKGRNPRLFLFLSVISFLGHCAYAASGTEGAAFLEIPVGAGPAALGSAYSALATDAYAPVWNPAGLGFLSSTQVAAQHLSYLESIHYEYLSVVHPVGPGKALGVSAQYLGSGDIAGTDPQGQPTGDYSDHYAAYSAAYGQKLTDKLSLGLTGKWINAKLADASANAFAADIGSFYQVQNNFHLAMTLTNLGSKLNFSDQADSLPAAFHFGAAYEPNRWWTLTGEGVYSFSGLLSERVGIAWSPLEMLELRTGYKTDTTHELSALAGFTVGMGLKVWSQELAYAWLPYGDLGDTHYFSWVIRFGAEEEAKRNLIQYQNIKRHQAAAVDGSPSKEDVDSSDNEQLIELLTGEGQHTAQKP